MFRMHPIEKGKRITENTEEFTVSKERYRKMITECFVARMVCGFNKIVQHAIDLVTQSIYGHKCAMTV